MKGPKGTPTILAAMILILGVLVFLYSQGPLSSDDPKPATNPKIPDYSGIKIDHIINRDVKMGEGQAAKRGDRLAMDYAVWVYDPKLAQNRGELVFRSESEIPFFLDQDPLSKELIGILPGGHREIIVPSQLAKDFQLDPWSWPPERILIFDFRVSRVY